MARKHYYDRTFSTQAVIQQQVEHEAIVTWARNGEVFPVQLEVPKKLVLSPTAAYIFGRQMFKRGISMMML